MQKSTLPLVALAMLAFAANSLLNRLALREELIDAASFGSLRLISGALVLWLLVRHQQPIRQGRWTSALALFVYVAGFSFAYLSLSAATGALLLFGAVQATMIGHGLWQGERLTSVQTGGLILALGGVIVLLLPGLEAPPLLGSALMILAGIAWGIYSLKGRGVSNPTASTAGNFILALPFVLLLSLVTLPQASITPMGAVYALLSGALASGLGYALWYAVLPTLQATSAATVQLSVPVITALGGALLLGETLTLRLLLVTVVILLGISLVIRGKSQAAG